MAFGAYAAVREEKEEATHEPKAAENVNALVPTDEQERIFSLFSDMDSEGRLKVSAKAGSSKTSSCVMLSQRNKVPSLYLTFNRGMADEARGKFPDHVEVRTTHSLAYGKFGSMLQHKLKRPSGPYKNVCGTGTEIARHFRIRAMEIAGGRTITGNAIGLAVKQTLANFESSGDDRLLGKHVSMQVVKRESKDKDFDAGVWKAQVMAFAKLLWKLRIDPQSDILATHDTYLKLFQLSNPDWSKWNVIYLDEQQDSSDCVIAMADHMQCKVVLVGDEFQGIYAWRGAVDAMKKIEGLECRLTTSFRFGAPIADVATAILQVNGEKELVRGFDKVESSVLPYLPESEKRYWVIYRTNIALIMDGVKLLLEGKSVALEMDVQNFIGMMNSAIALYEDRVSAVKHEDIMPYACWTDLVAEAEYQGGEIKRIVDLIVGKGYQKVLNMLSGYSKPRNPDITLTTAHKSKGRETDVVVLADDFPSCYDKDGAWVGLQEQERNLLYVAATRGKRLLCTNSTIKEILEKKGLRKVGSASFGAPYGVEVKSIVRFEDWMHTDLTDEVELQISNLMGRPMTDLEKFCEPDYNACDIDGNEIDQDKLNY